MHKKIKATATSLFLLGSVLAFWASGTQTAYAAPKCYAQLDAIQGVNYFNEEPCPNNALIDANSDTVYVFFRGEMAPRAYTNPFQAIQIIAETSIPAGCPYSVRQGPLAPGTVCPYAQGAFGVLDSRILNQTRDVAISADFDPFSQSDAKEACKADTGGDVRNSCIYTQLINILNFLTAGVGVVVVVMVVVGGIRYSAAQGNPQAIADARKIIVNALIALAAYLFMYGFLQWLIPGGVF